MADLAQDKRFALNEARVKHREALRQLLAERIVLQSRATLMDQFIHHNVPAGAIRGLDAVFEVEQAQKLVLESSLEGQQTKRVKTVAFEIHTAE